MEMKSDDIERTNEADSEMEYRELKYELEKVQRKKSGKNIVLIVVIPLFLITFSCSGLYANIDGVDFYGFFNALFFGATIGIIIAISRYLYLDDKENAIRKEILQYESNHIQEEIQENIFENSIKMSYKYLDQYYAQTKDQAQKGFFITVCVSVFGAILIGIGIVSMFMNNTNPSYVTCASGVITEFIATVFFYMYNKTVSSMSQYHNKLVLSHNISIALKVADTLPTEDKTKSKNLIISELLKDMNTHLIKSDSEDTDK